MKILFLMNQILGELIGGNGGDVKGFGILKQARKDKEMNVQVLCPAVGSQNFLDDKVYLTGKTIFEKYFSPKHVPFILLIYLFRTIESLKKVGEIETDFIYTTGDFFCNVIPAFVLKKRKNSIRWGACIFHVNEPPARRKSNFFFRSFVSYLMQKLSFHFIKKEADVIFVLHKGMKLYLERNGFNNKIVVSYFGRDLSRVKRQIKKSSEVERKKDLMFFNRVNPTKGIFDLPYIMARVKKIHPEIHLHIIGFYDETIGNKLLEEFTKVGVASDVTLYGYVKDYINVFRMVQSCSVFLQPSYEEGWSVVLSEVILCKRLPVAYNLPVYKEIYGDLFRVAPLGDKEKFADMVLEVLSLDRASYINEANSLYKVAESYDIKRTYDIERKHMLHGNL